jgi:hypothetical protein
MSFSCTHPKRKDDLHRNIQLVRGNSLISMQVIHMELLIFLTTTASLFKSRVIICGKSLNMNNVVGTTLEPVLNLHLIFSHFDTEVSFLSRSEHTVYFLLYKIFS